MVVERWFALASVTALTGAVSVVAVEGCSSENGGDKQVTADARDAGKGREAGARPVPDAAPAAGEEAPTTCMADASIDATKFAYKKPGVTKGACTAKEADDIVAFFTAKADKDEDIKVSEWETSVSEACAKCVFSDGTGETWTPIISKDDRIETVDRGGCIEAAGGNEACGKAYQQVNECRLVACLPTSQGGRGTCTTQGDFEDCLADSQGIFRGPCKDAFDAMTKSCGDDLDTYEDACGGKTYTFEGPIKVMCGGGEEGGGANAGE